MSIFKSTFKPFVVRQINARQNLLKQQDRPAEFAKYVSAKTPWVRMTSFVNYKGSADLAKKYVLMGGTLFDYTTTGAKIRAGLGGKGGSYASLGTNQYGIRPMPGISSVSVRNVAAYGSLAEATVRFYAWDVRQLEELSILFMRPGYKVLLEWGWSMFLNTSVSGESYKKKTDYKTLNTDYTTFTIDNTPFNTIDCFDSNINQDAIYEQIQILRHKYSGNYDGVLGFIKNFTYTLQENGSYECTAILISMGEVLESIRINDTVGINIGYNQLGSAPPPGATANGAAPDGQQIDYNEIKSQFELLFDEYCKLSYNNPRSNSQIITGIDSSISPNEAAYIDKYIYKYNSGFSLSPNTFGAQNFLYNPINYGFTGTASTQATQSQQPPPVSQPSPVSQDVPGDKRSYYYIQLAYFVHILNTFKTLYPDKSSSLIKIEIPTNPTDSNKISNGLCQASFNSISIDPNVAMIRNSKAVLFTDPSGTKGYRPEIFKTETQALSGPAVPDYNMREYLFSNTNFGQIGNIYINIKTIITAYKNLLISNNGNVYLGDLLSDLMSKISFSLGSINDFGKFVSDSTICIVDKHYTELPAETRFDSKFKINIAGNSTIVRKHSIESKIFPSQATMIAIAAQDRQNIASIQTSTYTYLNEGLEDRLFGNVYNQPTPPGTDEVAAKKALLNSILLLVQYVNNYVMVNKTISAFYVSNVGAMNGYLNTLLVELEGGTDYKAVVPISVNLEMDGISGLTIGEIFTVDKKVLPKDYNDKSIGFIVTNIAHQIITNSWITKIESQVCILDQEGKQLKSLRKADSILGDLYKQIIANKADNYTSIRYFNILGALVIDSFRKMFKVTDFLGGTIEVDNNKTPLYVSAALAEFAPGSIDLGTLLLDYTKAYQKTFPLNTNITQTTTQSPAPGGGTVTTTNTNTQQSRVVAINTADVVEKIIKNTTYYEAMVPDVKVLFDQELAKVVAGYKQYIATYQQPGFFKFSNLKTYLASASPVSGAVIGAVNVQAQNAVMVTTTTFFKIDINKAIDLNTGFLNKPIPLVFGYYYYEQ